MVNIETRQNEKFVMGYPYNSSIDAYFKHLPTEFVDNYNLSSVEVNTINDHKNLVLAFDRELYAFVIKLSAFIKGFELEGQPQIDDYNNLKASHNELSAKLDNITSISNTTETEFMYMQDNILSLRVDLSKIEEFITFHNSQLIEETYVYNDEYVTDTENRLSIIDTVIDNNINDREYYDGVLIEKIDEYVETQTPLSPYDFSAVSLKNLYESWKTRPEEYYQMLVDYFTNEYESKWTYGQSIMYDEKLSYANASKQIMTDISSRVQSTLFKKYEFDLEKEIKIFSLSWLETHPTFEPIDFTFAVETKRKQILEQNIIELEDIIVDKDQAVKSVVSFDMNNDYFKYQELIQLKRKYIFMNIMQEIDTTVLDHYDSQISNLEDNYFIVKNKLEQSTYWLYYSDLEMHRELLTELLRQKDIVDLALSRDFQKDSGSNDHIIAKIDYYNDMREDINKKITDMIVLKDRLELEKNVYTDESTLIKSKIFEIEQSIVILTNNYVSYFTSRISFFTQNIEKTEKETIESLIAGDYFRDLDNKLTEIMNYSTNVKWYDSNDQSKLFGIYKNVINVIADNMQTQWKKEFNQEILNMKKNEYYKFYFDKKLLSFYGLIHYFVLQKSFNQHSVDLLKENIDELLSIFNEYVKLSMDIKTDIVVVTDIFNYDNTFEFKISDGIEQEENIKETFSKFMDNILGYIVKKNLEFKIELSTLDNKAKIDAVWNDMEKKYV